MSAFIVSRGLPLARLAIRPDFVKPCHLRQFDIKRRPRPFCPLEDVGHVLGLHFVLGVASGFAQAVSDNQLARMSVTVRWLEINNSLGRHLEPLHFRGLLRHQEPFHQ